MKKNYCDITVIIDRSGSMSNLTHDVIGGFNTFVKEQKEVKGTATLSLVQFDDQYEVNYIAKDIQDVEDLTTDTYVPRGWTALCDAIGKTVVTTDERIRKMKKKKRPEKVVILIQTDGYENASTEYTSDKLKELVKQKEKNDWEFIFLGANIDALDTAVNMGIKASNAMTYNATSKGQTNAFASVSSNISNYRSGSVGSTSFTTEDKAKQSNE